MRATGEYRDAGDLAPGEWFDLNSGSDGDAVAARVLSVHPSQRPDLVRVEFVTHGGETGEAYLIPDMPVGLMAVHDFEDEEW